MLTIKFKRVGKSGQPSYRLVVQEKRSKLNGRAIDDLGWYSPITKKTELFVNRIDHWIKMGAKPTASVHNLLVREKILKLPKIAVHRHVVKKTEVPAEAPAA